MRESLGYAYYDLSRLEEAEAVFARMLERGTGDGRAHLGLGWVAHERGEHAEARTHFETALGRRVSAQAAAGLADSLWAQGEIGTDEAVLQMRAALAMEPDYEWAERRIGWIRLEAGEVEAAHTHFAGIVAARPYDMNARAGLMQALYDLGRFEDALREANRAIHEDPEDLWFLEQRALILFDLDRYGQVLRDADRLIGMAPDEPEGYVWRARALAELGRRGDALVLLDEALDRTGQSPWIAYERAYLLFEENRLDEALAQARHNAAQAQADSYDLRLLAQIRMARGDHDAARQALDRAKALDAADSYSHYYDAVLALRDKTGVAAALERFDRAMHLGLPQDWIGDFAGELFRAGYIAQAIAIRAKYPG